MKTALLEFALDFWRFCENLKGYRLPCKLGTGQTKKSEAIALMAEILYMCRYSLILKGFYLHDPNPQATVEESSGFEVRILASLNEDSRECLNGICAKHGYKMLEAKERILIFG